MFTEYTTELVPVVKEIRGRVSELLPSGEYSRWVGHLSSQSSLGATPVGAEGARVAGDGLAVVQGAGDGDGGEDKRVYVNTLPRWSRV